MRTHIIFLLILILFASAPGCTTKDMTLSDQGFRAISAGNYVEAEKHLEQALSENPDNPYALLNMGVVYQNTGRPEKATEMYERVIGLNPSAKATESNIETATGKPLVEIARENLELIKEQQKQLSPPEEKSPKEQPVQVAVEEKPEEVTTEPVETRPTPPPEPEPPGLKPPEPREPTSEKAVKVEKKTPEASRIFPEGRFYTLQVGAYQNSGLARDHMNALEKKGYESFYKKKTIKKKGMLYRVYLNRYGSKKEALSDAEKLRQSNVMTDYVLRVIEGPTKTKVIPKQMPKAEGCYLLVGSFKRQGNAEQAVKGLKASGQEAVYESKEVRGVTWFRVLIGPYESEGQAVRVGAALKKKDIISDFRPVKGR